MYIVSVLYIVHTYTVPYVATAATDHSPIRYRLRAPSVSTLVKSRDKQQARRNALARGFPQFQDVGLIGRRAESCHARSDAATGPAEF